MLPWRWTAEVLTRKFAESSWADLFAASPSDQSFSLECDSHVWCYESRGSLQELGGSMLLPKISFVNTYWHRIFLKPTFSASLIACFSSAWFVVDSLLIVTSPVLRTSSISWISVWIPRSRSWIFVCCIIIENISKSQSGDPITSKLVKMLLFHNEASYH